MIQTEDSLEILASPSQAEGESGSETIGFSTFGAQRINDAQKRRARPTSVLFWWNATNLAAQTAVPIPAPYWGTFITTFDGAILAGSRLDGVGANTRPWCLSITNPTAFYSDGSGGTANLGTTTNTVIGLPSGRCGFDLFLNMAQVNINASLFYWNPYTTSFATQPLVFAKVPQIGNYSMTGEPSGTPPFCIIRRRPEGYNAGEDGAQVFLSLPYANALFPAGFVDPATVLPASRITTGNTRIIINITP